MKKLYRDRLLKLAAFLETLARDEFYFGEYVKHYERKDAEICGTVCCAIGWCPSVFPRRWKWVQLYAAVKPILHEYKNYYHPERASGAAFFGLNWEEYDHLFIPDSQRKQLGGKRLYVGSPPQRVAENIRAFVAHKQAANSARVKPLLTTGEAPIQTGENAQ